MVHLTKAIIKKYGFTKKAWAVARGGHAHSSGNPGMPKKRSSRRYGRRLKRRFSKAKVPFETLIAAGTIPWTAAQTGWGTPFNCATRGDIDGIMLNLKSGFLGMSNGSGGIDLMAALNPFNMECARYTKILTYATILGMIRRKITGRYTAPLFKKIPLIGRFVS
jgi:hypothetical protein